MRRLLPSLCLSLVVLAPSVAFADVAPFGRGCNRCSVDDGGADVGLAAVSFLGMVAGAALLRRRRESESFVRRCAASGWGCCRSRA